MEDIPPYTWSFLVFSVTLLIVSPCVFGTCVDECNAARAISKAYCYGVRPRDVIPIRLNNSLDGWSEEEDQGAVYFMDQTHAKTGGELGAIMTIAFRGTRRFLIDPTSAFFDWITNVNMHMVELGNGMKVHRGFKERAISFEEPIRNLISKHKPERIFLTGHSLGAPVATITAFHLATTFPSIPIDLTTLASPRVGNCEFVNRRLPNLCTAHLQHIGDAVRFMPPGGGYCVPDTQEIVHDCENFLQNSHSGYCGMHVAKQCLAENTF